MAPPRPACNASVLTNASFGPADELHYAPDKHFKTCFGKQTDEFMRGTPPPPSRELCEDLSWEISSYNVRLGGSEPFYAPGTWQHEMLRKWPVTARREWGKYGRR